MNNMANINRSVQRCLAVLRSFRNSPRQTLTAITTEVRLPHPTVLRLLGTLEEEGYVRRAKGGWELAPRILEIGFAALQSMGIDEFVQSSLQRLADACSGTVNLGERNRDEVMIIARASGSVERRRLFIMNLRVGSTLPSSSALYTALDLVADKWSIAPYPDRKLVSIGIAVPNNAGRSLALGISVDINDYSTERIEKEIVPMLRREREEIQRLMLLGDI